LRNAKRLSPLTVWHCLDDGPGSTWLAGATGTSQDEQQEKQR
jgi:hypothetical protein